MKIILTLIGSFTFFCNHIVLASNLEKWISDGEQHAKTHAIISFGYISVPLNNFVLLKSQVGICAIKFRSYIRDHDATPGSMFHSGSETFHAEYDWFYQTIGHNRFNKNSLISGQGKVKRSATIGIGRLILPSTSARITCGDIKIGWNYPTYLPMYSGNNRNNSISVAPTGWSEINKVKIDDNRLSWYSYLDSRDTIYIPKETLMNLDTQPLN